MKESEAALIVTMTLNQKPSIRDLWLGMRQVLIVFKRMIGLRLVYGRHELKGKLTLTWE